MKLKLTDTGMAALRSVLADDPIVRRFSAEGLWEKPLSTWRWSDLVDGWRALHEANGRLLDRIKPDTPAAEAKNFEAAWDQVSSIVDQIQREKAWRDELGNRNPRDPQSGKADQGAQRDDNGLWFRDVNTGAAIRAVRHGESILKALPSVARTPARIGEFMRSVALGRWAPEFVDDPSFRTLLTTTTGVPIPTPIAGEYIDLARETSMVSQAGAVFVPMQSKTLEIARITGDPSGSWVAENNAVSASDPTLDTVTLTAKRWTVLVKSSDEAVQDSPNFAAEIERQLREVASGDLDEACLVGSGTGAEPGGIMKSGITANTDVQTYNVGGTPTSYDFVSRGVQLVRTANHVPNAMFAHPRTYGTLDRLKDSQNQPLQPPPSYSGLTHYQSTRIPVNLENGASPNDGTIAIVGKFSELLVGVRLAGELLVSRVSYDGTDSALTKNQTHFRLTMRMDVQLARGAAFCVAHSIND